MKNTKQNLNLIISSWPSAGGTTTALILANIFNLNYIYAGGLLKEWANLMGYDPTSSDFHDWEIKYGDFWDQFWEDYIQKKLAKTKGFLCEGKTTGFLMKQGQAFEVMITANDSERNLRAGMDGRTENISARDDLLRERWGRLFNIDIFSEELIRANYDLKIDNSQISLKDTTLKIIEKIEKKYKINVDLNTFESLFADVKNNKIDKNILRERLKQSGNYSSNEEIFQEWLNDYQDELNALPSEMLEALQKC